MKFPVDASLYFLLLTPPPCPAPTTTRHPFVSSSMRMPKLSVTSSLDFDERDEEDFFDPGGRQRRSGSGMPAPRPHPSPTQPPSSVSGSLPTTPSFAGESIVFTSRQRLALIDDDEGTTKENKVQTSSNYKMISQKSNPPMALAKRIVLLG